MSYLTPRDPFNVSSLRRHVDDVFDNFFPSNTSQAERPDISVDVLDKGEAYIVKANIPGISAKDLDVQVTKDNVIIKGSYSEEKEDTKENYVLRERRSGSFMRSLPLENINPDISKAKFKDGVLELTLPKLVEAINKGRQLEIEE